MQSPVSWSWYGEIKFVFDSEGNRQQSKAFSIHFFVVA